MKRLISAPVMLVLLAFVGSNAFAQNTNDLLLLQSLENPLASTTVDLQARVYQNWRDKGALKIRTQHEGDQPGTFNTLYEFDKAGNLLRKVDGKNTQSISYDADGHLRKINNFDSNKLVSAQYFYYDRNGSLRKSVLKNEADNSELEGTYDTHNHLKTVRWFSKGIATKTVNIQSTYDADGQLVAMNAPGLSATYLYADGKLSELREEKVGQNSITNFFWDGNMVKEWKKYQEKDGDLILSETVSFENNAAGIAARKTVKGRGPSVNPVVTNFYYDSFEAGSVAMRGDDWDGGGYGYGTPVVITWSNPDSDTRVTDSIYSLRMTLKPGVGQQMPEIKNMTLRLNHQLTNKEIGHVVLKKVGTGNEYFIEEKLPLLEGSNTIYLDVETQLGRFSSGERFITYKNPNREIKVKDLHVLAIGIDDYTNDDLDLTNANKDVQSLVTTLENQKGRMFNEVKTKVISNQEATKANIEEAIRQIKGKAAKDDLVLIYFAGHGAESGGSFYLKPTDVKSDPSEMEISSIDNRWIMEEISRYSAPTLYFLDASYPSKSDANGATVGNANMDAVQNDFGKVIDNDDEIRIFVSSTSSKQKSNVGADKGSLFTVAMLEGLDGKADLNDNGLVTVEELGDYVSDRVLGQTSWKQKPTLVKRGIGMVPLAKVK
ncbi:MAG: caspase family protein [Bacteroidetes bacterium]|nr:caspase family protein [Bacteroidota bacterium]